MKLAEGVDFIPPQIHAHGALLLGRVEIDNSAADGVFARGFDNRSAHVHQRLKLTNQAIAVDFLSLPEVEGAGAKPPGRGNAAGEGLWRGEDNSAPVPRNEEIEGGHPLAHHLARGRNPRIGVDVPGRKSVDRDLPLGSCLGPSTAEKEPEVRLDAAKGPQRGNDEDQRRLQTEGEIRHPPGDGSFIGAAYAYARTAGRFTEKGF